MSDTVKYACIGAGAIAQRRHLPEAHANPKSEVAAIADPVADRVKEIAKLYDAKAFDNHKDMLKKGGFDAVVVAGPNKLHAPMAIEALEAGYHVLCEKPMATTREDGKKMVATAKSTGKSLMIGMNQRLMPPHAKARELIEAKGDQLGRVISFETSFKHPGPDGWSVDGAKSWFFKKDPAAMGVCGDLGVHKADLMRYLLGEEITRVGGMIKTLDKKDEQGNLIPVDDNAYVVMQTASGTIGTMNISWTHYGGFEDNGTTLYCEKGVMRIGLDRDWGVMIDYRNGQQERYKVGAVATNTKQVASGIIDSFTDAILAGRAPVIDGVEGYRAMNVIITAMEAADEGTFKDVDMAIE
jgi:predicted dehydrogenase